MFDNINVMNNGIYTPMLQNTCLANINSTHVILYLFSRKYLPQQYRRPYILQFGGGFDDSFKYGIPTETAEGKNEWIRGTGSYYYWPHIIGAGEKLSSSSTLFKSYDLDPAWIPEIWIPVGATRQQAKGVHLVFECAVQAIGVPKKTDGTNYTWQEAWSAATGETIGPKN